jgi:hypothetical protein
MAPTRKQSFATRPHEAAQAEHMDAQDQIDSDLDIQ